jgi:hypothetical protein
MPMRGWTAFLLLALLPLACNRTPGPQPAANTPQAAIAAEKASTAVTSASKPPSEDSSNIEEPGAVAPEAIAAEPLAAPPTVTPAAANPPDAAPTESPVSDQDRSDEVSAPSNQELAEHLANRVILGALLKEDRISQLPGLRSSAIAALSRVPGVTFEQRAAWGLLLLPSSPSPELDEAQRMLRFATAEVLGEADLAKVTILLRKNELAQYRNEGYEEPLGDELRMCQWLTAATAPALLQLADSEDVKKLAAANGLHWNSATRLISAASKAIR